MFMSNEMVGFWAKRAGGDPPVNTVAPVVSGLILENATLTTTDGTWLNSPTGYTYQWKRDGASIGGATSQTYVVQAADVGTSLSVTVTASNAFGSASADSNALEDIVAALLWYDPSDLSTLFTDAAGTTPVTTDGDLVRYVTDKSGNGHDAVNNGADAGVPVYHTGSGLHWVTFTAASLQSYNSGPVVTIVQDMAAITAFNRAAAGTNSFALNGSTAHTGWWFTDNKIYGKLGGTESTGSTADTSTGDFVLTTQRDATNEVRRLNAVQVGTRAAPAVSGGTLYWGRTQGGTYTQGKCYQVLVVGSISAAQLAALETEVGVKAGLSI
jgi:hypothetical protein